LNAASNPRDCLVELSIKTASISTFLQYAPVLEEFFWSADIRSPITPDSDG
jgi:hypothetical protein